MLIIPFRNQLWTWLWNQWDKEEVSKLGTTKVLGCWSAHIFSPSGGIPLARKEKATGGTNQVTLGCNTLVQTERVPSTSRWDLTVLPGCRDLPFKTKTRSRKPTNWSISKNQKWPQVWEDHMASSGKIRDIIHRCAWADGQKQDCVFVCLWFCT